MNLLWRRRSLYKKPRHCATGASVVLDTAERTRRTSENLFALLMFQKKKAPASLCRWWTGALTAPGLLLPFGRKTKPKPNQGTDR